VSQVESCFATEQTYVNCDTSTALGSTGLAYGTGAGQVSVLAGATANSYTVEGVSKATTGGAHKFDIAKDPTGVTRTCTPTGQGGCPASGSW